MLLSKIKVTQLKNVGSSRAAALSRLGAETVEDLLHLYPRAYENKGDIKLLSETVPDEKQALCLTVATAPKKAFIRKGMSLLKFRAYDDSGTAEITYFNQDYLADKFSLGTSYRFYGKVEKNTAKSGKAVYSMSSPVPEEIRGSIYDMPALLPVYPLASGLTRGIMTKLMQEAVGIALREGITDPVPADILSKNELCTRYHALKNIHSPETLVSLGAAKKRLIFDEFFIFALGLSLAGRKRKKETGALKCLDSDISPLLDQLPYGLTGAQQRAVERILSDMALDTPMNRILVGDVGCGKTVCAAAALYCAVKNGRQAALMAPTEILANQHFNDLEPIFSSLGIRVRLLTGSLTQGTKKKIYESLLDPEPQKRTDILIGTHALISEGVKFHSIGLVVTDEQHRFGAKQRAALAKKGEAVHTLIMSATPIPRSLALTMYGDLDISLIDEMPPGRQRVNTFVVNEGYRERLFAFIDKQLDAGGQVYVVCPAVEEKDIGAEALEEGEISLLEIPEGGDLLDIPALQRDEPPLKNAVGYAKDISGRFPCRRVAFVHGKLKSSEKDRVMNDFAAGEIDILVSTTVIEVGVNVPNACLMIVENAERFGLSQLHQLRGRVGRGSRRSYCILVSDCKGERASERLNTMKTMYDGFAIAEKDLKMRGPGDFLESAAGGGIRQSGGIKFRLADMASDAEVMSSAFEAARELASADPELSDHPELLVEIEDMFNTDHTD